MDFDLALSPSAKLIKFKFDNEKEVVSEEAASSARNSLNNFSFEEENKREFCAQRDRFTIQKYSSKADYLSRVEVGGRTVGGSPGYGATEGLSLNMESLWKGSSNQPSYS